MAGVKPARMILDVQPRDGYDGNGHLAFLMREPGRQDRWVPAAHIRYGERGDAWAAVFGEDAPVAPWKGPNGTDLRSILAEAREVGGKLPEIKKPEPEQDDNRSEDNRSVPATSLGDDDAAVQLAELLRKLGGKSSVDEDQVRAICGDLIREQVASGITVQFGDNEPVEIEGIAHAMLPTVLKLVNRGRYPWLVGPAGTGKSTLGRQVAESLGVKFRAIGCNPMMSTSALLGYMDAQGRYVSTPFRECYEDGGVFLLDEIDASHPAVLVALNDALASGECAFPDGMVVKSDRFYCVVAANTYGKGGDRQYVGRCALDAATVNRFKMLAVDYDPKLERALAVAHNPEKGEAWLEVIRSIRRNAASHGVLCVVSTRAVIDCDLLDDGFTADEILEMSVFQGLGEDQKSKLLTGVNTKI